MLTRAEPGPRTLCSASRQTTPLTLLSLRSSTSARASRHQPLRCNAQANPPEQQQEDVEYKDSWSDIQFINMCRTAYGNLSGWQSPRDWKNGPETYQGMIEVSRALMKVCVRCSNCCKMEYTLPVGAKVCILGSLLFALHRASLQQNSGMRSSKGFPEYQLGLE